MGDINKRLIAIFAALLVLFNATPVQAASISGTNCSKIGLTKTVGSIKYTCIKKGAKKVWNGGTRVVKSLTKTPTPIISGVAEVGETLTVDVGEWDAGVVLSIQWFANGASIEGEDQTSLDLSDQELDESISVQVVGKKTGFTTVTRVSKAIGPVAASSDPNLLAPITLAPTPQVFGNEAVNNTLRAVAGTWDVGVRLAYQWLRNGAAIPGAISSIYKISSDDVGATLSVSITGSKPNVEPVTKISNSTSAVVAAPLGNAPIPTISGTNLVGQTLTANSGTWDAGTALSFQWLRNGMQIAGATLSTYTLVDNDVNSVISVQVQGSKTGFASVIQESDPTLPIARPALVNTPTPTISGLTTLGQTLTANTGTWDAGVTLSYEWSRDGVAIIGATSRTYLLALEDVGTVIAVSVTGSKKGLPSVTKNSPVTRAISAAALISTPVPTISGSTVVGQTLTAVPGSWDSGTTLAYQWLRGGVAISGATSATYTLSSLELGLTVSVSITGSKNGYSAVTKTSNATAAVTQPTFAASPVPTISGSAVVGQTLTAVAGTWDTGTTLGYQWLRSGSAISGATSASYVIVLADAGATISVSVTGSKTGYAPSTKTSNPTTAITQPTFTSAPVPTISGATTVGSVLTGTTGTWDSGTTLSLQWKRNGIAILGANGATYTIASADVGFTFTFEVTGSKTNYVPLTKVSAMTAAVSALTFTLSPTPSISGTAMVGKILTATVGVWDSGTTFTYAWLRNGNAITGATGTTYSLTTSDQGFVITFSVTGSKTGAVPLTRTSAATTSVAPATFTTQGTPTISGLLTVGSTLTVNPGTWDAGTTFTYQWYGNLILTGQTGQSFTLRSSEKGVSVYVIMKATNGFATVSKTITTSGPVAAGTLTVGNATFYGDLVVGGQLYRTDGTWTPGTTLTYQWLSNGNPIVGQTSYMMYAGVATLGTSISLRVTGTLAGYNTASVTTAAQGPIGLGTIGSWSIGTVTGGTLDPNTGKTRAKTGDVLGMSKASWCATNLSTATTITYQWTRNGTAVAGQTGVTYTVTNADSGAQVGYTTYCASTGYTTRSWATPTMEILQAPTLPTITSIDQSQVTSLRVNFNGVAGNTNTFAIVYSATNKQSPKICDTNSCTFNNLSGSTTYTIEYTATASGGSISGTTTATTYPRLTLNATINSFTKQGDKWTVTYQPISTWTYEFVWETYGLGTSGCTNGTAGVTTQSPISVFANIRTGCQKALRVLDGHGNSADVLLDYYTTVAVPAMSLTGSLASSTATLDANVTFNYSVTSYYAYATRTLVLLNSAGTSVTLAIAPTVARISGDTYNGAYQGTLYLTGVAAGSYTVRLTISDSSGASSTVVLGALTVG